MFNKDITKNNGKSHWKEISAGFYEFECKAKDLPISDSIIIEIKKAAEGLDKSSKGLILFALKSAQFNNNTPKNRDQLAAFFIEQNSGEQSQAAKTTAKNK